MQINKAQAQRIVTQVAELADIAAAKDIDVAATILRNVAITLGIKPETIPLYVELCHTRYQARNQTWSHNGD